MPASHRNNDTRTCGATTIVTGQSFVSINNQLWAVKGDKNTHGDGELINSQSYVTINGMPVILQGDNAQPDDQMHQDPAAQGFDSTVTVS